MSKKILLVTGIFPPIIGGPATFMDRMAHELSTLGYRVTVVCASESRSDPSDAARPFRVRRVSMANRYLFEVMVRLRLAWELLWHRMVYVNGLESYFSDANRLCRRKYFLKIVGDSAWERVRNLGVSTLDIDRFQTDAAAQTKWADLVAGRNRYVLAATRVFTPSCYLRGMVQGWGVPVERVTVIPNGVEKEFLGLPPPVGRAAEAPLNVLFVGRMTNWKGVETLLLAVQKLEHVHLRLAGEGPEWPMLEALIRQLGIGDRVTPLGKLPRAKVSEAMRLSHVLVLTSLYEGMSHTLIEAQAHSLPCVASDCGGNSEVIVHGESGWLIPPQDPAALASALAELRDNEPLRRQMAARAFERAQEFRLGNSVRAVVEHFERLG